MKDYKQVWNNLSTTIEDAAHFVGYQDDEDSVRENGKTTATFLREVLRIEPDDRVLEIGCGIARIGRELAPFCGEWHGADISGNMIHFARTRTKDIPDIYLHELPESSLDIFTDGYFDCIYSSIVFMHLDKVEVFRYISDSYRVLAPAGRVYFDTYNVLAPEGWKQFSEVVRNYPAGKGPGHVSQFSTPQELQKFMEQAHFEDIHVNADNPQLVVAVGRKQGERPQQRPSSPMRPDAQPPKQDIQSPDYSDDESSREWKVLSDNLQAKDRYITTLEEALRLKQDHIASLERIVRRYERSTAPALVRLALRLTRPKRPRSPHS